MKPYTLRNDVTITLLYLQIVGFTIIYNLWKQIGPRGVILGSILSFILNLIIVYFLHQTTVVGDDGKKKNIGDSIRDALSVVVYIALGSVILILVGGVMGYRHARHKNKSTIIGISIPFLAIGSLYGAFFLMVKVCSNMK